MPPTRIDDAKYTLKDIWLYTYRYYNNRFEYRERDVLKGVDIRRIKSYSKDRPNAPSDRIELRTYSYPQYTPYVELKGKKSKKQRKVKHQYNIVFTFKELVWESPFTWRVGSQRKYPKDSNINYKEIKQLHSSIRERFEKKYGKGTKEYRKAVARHKKKAKYIDKGDYISQVYGINGDFYFRVQGNAFRSGNLFGLPWNKEKFGNGIPFFDKHSLRVVAYLLKRKIIKRESIYSKNI